MGSLPLMRIALIGLSSGVPISRLSSVKVFHDIPFRTEEFITDDELDTALAALTCGKAAGIDEVVNEILRRPELSDCILDILNMCNAIRLHTRYPKHVLCFLDCYQ